MAIGDVVSGFLNAAGTFQPAAGVEVVLTSFQCNAGAQTQPGLTNGVTTAYMFNLPPEQTSLAPLLTNTKIFVNNTRYLIHQYATTLAYTGMQTK